MDLKKLDYLADKNRKANTNEERKNFKPMTFGTILDLLKRKNIGEATQLLTGRNNGYKNYN